MEHFIHNAYTFELVDDNPKATKYDFVSVGKKNIPKRVSIRQFPHKGYEQFYNLGFGNISIDKNGAESISDMSRDNNQDDANKVLRTVIVCALDFLVNNPNATLLFYGNTHAKQRLYKIGINNNLEDIRLFLNLKGFIIDDIKLKDNNDGSKELANKVIEPNSIFSYPYKPINSNQYHFITLELKDELK